MEGGRSTRREECDLALTQPILPRGNLQLQKITFYKVPTPMT